MNTLAKTLVPALAALGFASTAAVPALAQEFDQVKVNVSYADLDLGTAQGQKTLDQRIEKAVRVACRTTKLNTGTRIMSNDALNCLAKARADAKQQVAAIMINEQRGG